MSIKQAISLGKETYKRWDEHQATRLGASVAFYSILSFAPLLVLITAVIAIVFGHANAQGALVNEARQWIGDRGADTVEGLLKDAQKPASGIFASVVAFITLLIGASSVFTELQDALNIMWDAPGQNVSGFMAMIKQRLFSFGMILSIGFLLLISLLVSAGLEFAGKEFGRILPMPDVVLESINFVVSFAVVTILFGLMFKYVPNVRVRWRNVLVGAIGTALLFTVGKFLLGLYLAKASVGSTYGAAGSLVAVVVWIYYSAQIFFFGAEFTRVYADYQTGKLAPATANAGAAAQDSTSAKPAVPPSPKEQPAPVAAQQEPVFIPAPTPPRPVPMNLVKPRPLPAAAAGRTARVTKPRLLMALGLGFALGRVVRLAKSKS